MPIAALDCPRRRARLYALAGLLLFALGLLAVSLKPRFDLIVADGRYYYVYLPSLFVDGALDFHNQIVEHWPPAEYPALGIDVTARGLTSNHFPVGVALTLAPAFVVAHGLCLAGHALTGCA